MPPTIRSRRHAVPEMLGNLHQRLRYEQLRQQQFVFNPSTGAAQAIIGWLAQDNAGNSTGLSGYGIAALVGSNWTGVGLDTTAGDVGTMQLGASAAGGTATKGAAAVGHVHSFPALNVAALQPSAQSTSSASAVMMGFAMSFTPARVQNVLIGLWGRGFTATAAVNFTIASGRYGTGTAPVNGASVTGTAFGPGMTLTPPGINAATAWGFVGLVSNMTIGSANWIDIAANTSNAADQLTLGNVSGFAFELG